MNKFYCCKVLCNNYWSCNLIGPYHFWVISPRNLTLFTRPFLAGKRARGGHETNTIVWQTTFFIVQRATPPKPWHLFHVFGSSCTWQVKRTQNPNAMTWEWCCAYLRTWSMDILHTKLYFTQSFKWISITYFPPTIVWTFVQQGNNYTHAQEPGYKANVIYPYSKQPNITAIFISTHSTMICSLVPKPHPCSWLMRAEGVW